MSHKKSPLKMLSLFIFSNLIVFTIAISARGLLAAWQAPQDLPPTQNNIFPPMYNEYIYTDSNGSSQTINTATTLRTTKTFMVEGNVFAVACDGTDSAPCMSLTDVDIDGDALNVSGSALFKPLGGEEGIRIISASDYSPLNIQDTSGTDIFRVDQSGSLAVGTVPLARLGACTDGQVVKYGSSGWACGADSDGGITTEADPKIGTLTSDKWCKESGGKIVCSSDAPGGLSGGAANYLARWSDTDSMTISVIRDNGSTIGIGKAPNSSYKVDVEGDIRGNNIYATDGNIYGKSGRRLALQEDGNLVFYPSSLPAGFAGGLQTWDLRASGSVLSQQYCDVNGNNCKAITAMGGGGIGGSGSSNYLTKFTGTTNVGNSIVTDNGSTVIVGGNLGASGWGSFGGNISSSGNISANGDVSVNGKIIFGGELLATNGRKILLQSDNNLVWYNGSTALWSSKNPTVAGSDLRLKNNIATLDVDDALENIMKLNGVSFTWKDDGRKDFGFIAQEVEKIYPELVITDKDKDGIKRLEYSGLIAPIVQAIKSQQIIIEDQNRRINNLMAQKNADVEALKQENEELWSVICELKPEIKHCQK